MEYLESIIITFQQLSPIGVLGVVFLAAYLENIFPPSPSDVILIFAGTLIGAGIIGFMPALVIATLGSTFGFMTAYAVGRYFHRWIMAGRFARYLPLKVLQQVERLFQRYGYSVIIANRFLAGTRAFISFFAGMSRMNLALTTLLCAAGAAAWNALLLYLGMIFATNWRRIIHYLGLYSKFMTIIMVLVFGIIIWRYLRRRRTAKAQLSRTEK